MAKKSNKIFKGDFYVVYPQEMGVGEERLFEFSKYVEASNYEKAIKSFEPVRKHIEVSRSGAYYEKHKKEFEVGDSHIFYFKIKGNKAISYDKKGNALRTVTLINSRLDCLELDRERQLSTTKMRLEGVVLVENIHIGLSKNPQKHPLNMSK